MQSKWNHTNDPRLGIMDLWSRMLGDLDRQNSSTFPDFSSSQSLLLGTDFGGEHKQSKYITASCLIADWEKCNAWLRKREIVRDAFLPDGRRMAFKSFNDSSRRNAFLSYLNAADQIPGILVTVAIEKRSQHLWSISPFVDSLPANLYALQNWPTSTLDKAFRVTEIASLFLAGLSSPGQNLLWITDEDEIAANLSRQHEFCQLFEHVSGHYLKYGMGKFNICTTNSDAGSRDVEDFVGIADLAAGAVSESLTKFSIENKMPPSLLFGPEPKSLSEKARYIMAWISATASTKPLKKMSWVADAGMTDDKLRLAKLDCEIGGGKRLWTPRPEFRPPIV